MKAQYFRHFKTVCSHRHKVLVHCIKAGIIWRGLLHDLSKFSPEEFIPSACHYQGNRSPNEGEREDYGCSMAWMHHKGRNKHHFEYWRDLDPDTSKRPREYIPVKMPLVYVIEMFCDRIAASKVYKGKDFDPTAPAKYFSSGSAAKKMHPDTARLLGQLLDMYAQEGEDKTFSYIKNTLKKQKTY